MMDKLDEYANSDPLTGLPHRSLFEARLREEVRRARRDKNPFVLMIVDLDFFKLINETLGQRWGNQILQKVADVLRHRLKPGETLCRMDGDEFVILLPGRDLARGESLGRDLLKAIAKTRYPGQHLFEELFPEGKLTASIGLTVFSQEVEREFDLIAWADYALFRAKRHGRNRLMIQEGPPHGSDSAKKPLALFQALGGIFPKDIDFSMKLQRTAELIQEWLGVDVCSLYLLEEKNLVLRATVGLNPDSVGKVRMRTNEGLTGLVIETMTRVCATEAAKHPRYKFFAETGEEQFGSYLGVPILYGDQALGVIVVQTRRIQDFSEQEVAVVEAIAGFLGSVMKPI